MPAPFVVAFVVGVTPGKWARVWAERLPRHPLELRAAGQEHALQGVRAGEVDAAFLRLPVTDESLSAIPLYEEQPVVVAAKDHPVEAFAALSGADLDGETVLQGEWDAVIPLAATGVGVAIVPQSVARAHSRRDVVTRPITDRPTTRVALVWRTDRSTAEMEELIGIVRGRTANSSRGTQERGRRR